jgi:hypothetical protein
MTFTPGIPNTGQSLGSTRDAIRDNFTNYFDTMSVNHVAPNGTPQGTQGKHTFAEFVAQSADPSTTPSETTLYSKTTSGSNTELFIRKDNDGSVYQLTNGVPAISAIAYASGNSFIAGGLLVYWGILSATGGPQTFTGVFNFPTTCIQVFTQVSNIGASPNAFVYVASFTKTNLTIDSVTRTANSAQPCIFSFLAIGI